MKYTIEIKVILEEEENHTTEELEEKLKELLENVSVNSGFGKVTCEDGRVVRGEEMKYTLELKATIEDDNVYTDEQLGGTAKEFLENLNEGKITITTEDGRVIEVSK